MKRRKRKCQFCKNEIDTKKDDGTFFYYGKPGDIKCAHKQCYVDYCTTRKRQPMTVEECNAFIEECKSNETILLSVKKTTIKDELNNFISDMYGITYLPNFFYKKMASIYDGSYKQLSRPVPPEDLLDMWKQKKSFLLKQAEIDKKRGKEIDGLARVNYDLAILLGRYDKYLKWKEQQKIAQAEIEEQKKKDAEFVSYKDISTSKPKKKENEIDISSMLDEI